MKNTPQFSFLKGEGYERILKIEKENEFSAYITVHNTKRGPSLGGCRLWKYENKEDALLDSMALAEAMTYKNCMADLPHGGGKTAIHVYNNNSYDKKEILKYVAEGVELLRGDYIIAEDVNISCDDLDIVRKITNHVVEKSAGDPGPVTAKGVYNSIKWYKNTFLKREKISLLIQGVGSVGKSLLKLLLNDNEDYTIYVSDLNKDNYKEFKNKVLEIKPDKIFEYEYDIFSPCALGGIINDKTINLLKCKAIIGSANNQVATLPLTWELMRKNIYYAPDFVVNSGGVIQVTGFVNGKYDENIVEEKLARIPKILEFIHNESVKENIPDYIKAMKIAKNRLELV